MRLKRISNSYQKALKIMEKVLIYGYYFQRRNYSRELRCFGKTKKNINYYKKMFIAITVDTSADVGAKFDNIGKLNKELEVYFGPKHYGEDLENIYIYTLCLSPNFERFYKAKRPNYKKEKKIFIDHGVQVENPPNCLTYDLKFDYQIYKSLVTIEPVLAEDIMKSLTVIETVKKIKDFNFISFKEDFESFFKEKDWI